MMVVASCNALLSTYLCGIQGILNRVFFYRTIVRALKKIFGMKKSVKNSIPLCVKIVFHFTFPAADMNVIISRYNQCFRNQIGWKSAT